MRLLSITAMKNEGPFLLEWLAYHRLIGFTDFLIYSNDCEDGTDLMLDLLAREGIVTHQRHERPANKSVQWQALKLARDHPLYDGADWVLFSDVDEFPKIDIGAGRIPDLIAAAPEATDAIALPWRLFGSSGHYHFADQPVTQQFTRSAPYPMLHPIAATHFKTLFRPKSFQTIGVHRPKRRPKDRLPNWVTADLSPLPAPFASNDKRLSLLNFLPPKPVVELYHYSVRSVESFLVKRARGLSNRATKTIDLGYWVERNFNNVENLGMQPWAEPLTKEIAALKALPGLGDLHEAACAKHREVFQKVIREVEGYTLLTHCLHVSSSAALSHQLSRQLYQAYQKLER